MIFFKKQSKIYNIKYFWQMYPNITHLWRKYFAFPSFVRLLLVLSLFLCFINFWGRRRQTFRITTMPTGSICLTRYFEWKYAYPGFINWKKLEKQRWYKPRERKRKKEACRCYSQNDFGQSFDMGETQLRRIRINTTRIKFSILTYLILFLIYLTINLKAVINENGNYNIVS